MTVCSDLDKKVTSLEESDPFESLVKKIVGGVRDDGFRFSGKLREIRGEECWFSKKNGISFMVRRSHIIDIREVIPRRA
jgi:hypothetical protein